MVRRRGRGGQGNKKCRVEAEFKSPIFKDLLPPSSCITIDIRPWEIDQSDQPKAASFVRVQLGWVVGARIPH